MLSQKFLIPYVNPAPQPTDTTSWTRHSPVMGHMIFTILRTSPPIDGRLCYPLLQRLPWNKLSDSEKTPLWVRGIVDVVNEQMRLILPVGKKENQNSVHKTQLYCSLVICNIHQPFDEDQ